MTGKVRGLLLAVVLGLSVMLSSLSNNITTATPTPTPTTAAVADGVVQPVGLSSMCSNERKWEAGDKYLPVNRWGDVSSFYTRLGTGALGTGNLANRLQKQMVASMFYSSGNMSWQVAVGLTVAADEFCVPDSTFRTVDKMAASVGKSMLNGDTKTPSLIGMLTVVSMVMVTWAFWRGRDGKKKAVSFIIALLVLVTMVTGASKTTDSKFGLLSPGYIANAINNSVGTVVGVPARALDAASQRIADDVTSVTAQDCSRYIEELEKRYDWWYTTGGKVQRNSVIPRSLNTMWKQTGLKVFTDAQFGSGNPWGSKVNCRYLDIAVKISPDEQLDITNKLVESAAQRGEISGGNKFTIDQKPFHADSPQRVDAAVIAWAACKIQDNNKDNVASEDDWANFNKYEGNNAKDTPQARKNITEACKQFLDNVDGSNFGADNDIWNLGDDAGELADNASAAAKDFTTNWHGVSNTTAIGIVMIYSLVSMVVAFVFGVLAIAVMGAKIGLVVITLMMILAMVLAVLPNDSAGDKLLQVFKQYVGMSVLAFGAALILSMIAAVTAIMQNLGRGMTSGNLVVAIMWAGMSPLIAIVLVHYIFTKVLKAPSPFKATSAMGFAQAAAGGAVGGAVGGGLLSRQMDKARSAAGRGVMDRLPGARRKPAAAAAGAGGERKGGLDIDAGKKPTTGKGKSLETADVRDGLAPDADQSALPGEDKLAAKDTPGGASQFAREASDWAAEQRFNDRMGKATVVAGAVAGAAGGVWAGARRAAGGVKEKAAGAWEKARQDATVEELGGKVPPKNGLVVARQLAVNTKNSFGEAQKQKAEQKAARLAAFKQANDGRGPAAARVKGLADAAKQTGSNAKRSVANVWNDPLGAGKRAVNAAGRGVRTAGVQVARGAKVAPKAVFKASRAAAMGARNTGQFVSRHKTALTAAAMGVATVGTAGIAAPVAAVWLGKKSLDAAKGHVSKVKEQKQNDTANYIEHLKSQAQAEVERRNAAALEAAEAKRAAEEAKAKRAETTDKAPESKEPAQQGPKPDNERKAF